MKSYGILDVDSLWFLRVRVIPSFWTPEPSFVCTILHVKSSSCISAWAKIPAFWRPQHPNLHAILMWLIWMVNPNQFWDTLCLDTHYKRRRWLYDDFWCPVFPSLPVIKKGPKLPRRGSQLSVGMADAAFVADNHGAWLKFAPCSMSDEQWEVAAKTPEAHALGVVTSSRSTQRR